MNTHSVTQGVLNANKLAHEKAKCVFEITQGQAVCVLIKTSFHAIPQWSALVLVKTKTKRLFFMLRFEKFTVGGLRNSSSSFFSFLFFLTVFMRACVLAQDWSRSASTVGCPLTPVPLN